MADLAASVRRLYKEQFPDHRDDDETLAVLVGFAKAVERALDDKPSTTKSIDPAKARKGGG